MSIADRFECKDLFKKFNKYYAYITQIVRLFDTNLEKKYLFTSVFAKLLPPNPTDKLNLDDKIMLEFSNIRETFKGSIMLDTDTKDNVFVPTGDKNRTLKDPKFDLLQNIIDKINIAYEGKFDESMRVIVEKIYDKIISNDDKQLKRQAQKNTQEMFISSIFPKVFEETAMGCYENQTEAFRKLFEDKQLFETVMKIIGNELFKSLR